MLKYAAAAEFVRLKFLIIKSRNTAHECGVDRINCQSSYKLGQETLDIHAYESCLGLPEEEIEMLAHSVGVLGLVFGFMRPLVLGQDRAQAKRMAATVSKMLVRGVDATTGVHQLS